MNNMLYGKTMESLRKRMDLELVTNTTRAKMLISRPTTRHWDIITENLVSIKKQKPNFCPANISIEINMFLSESFYSERTQRVHGHASILGGLFRRALPFLSSGHKFLGQQAMNVALDMLHGKSFQDSARSRLKEGIKTFVTSNPIIPQSESGVRRNRRRQLWRKQSKKTKREGFQICLHSMAVIHDQSCECAKTVLDVFSVPPTQTCIEYGNYVEYHPLSSITDSGPIIFDVWSSGQNYLDFANTQLLVKAKITRGNGDDITITWKESTCFYIAYSSKSPSR